MPAIQAIPSSDLNLAPFEVVPDSSQQIQYLFKQLAEQNESVANNFDDTLRTLREGRFGSAHSTDFFFYILNVYVVRGPEADASPQKIRVSILCSIGEHSDGSRGTIKRFQIALYNHSTGKISDQKNLTLTSLDDMTVDIMPSECTQDPDPALKALIEEHYKVDKSKSIQLSVLLFDKDGRLVVPSRD